MAERIYNVLVQVVESLQCPSTNRFIITSPWCEYEYDGGWAPSSSSSLISSSLHSHVTLYLKWCDKIKLSNLLLLRKSGTIKSLQLLSTSAPCRDGSREESGSDEEMEAGEEETLPSWTKTASQGTSIFWLTPRSYIRLLWLSLSGLTKRDWYFIAEQPAPAPHLAHPEGCAALRIVLVTVPRVRRSCDHLRREGASVLAGGGQMGRPLLLLYYSRA